MSVRLMIGVAVLVGLAGCTSGSQFVKPGASTLQMGVTTEAAATVQFGEPKSKATNVIGSDLPRKPEATDFDSANVAGTYQKITYSYIDRSKHQIYGGAVEAKNLILWFFNDRLVSYSFLSTFDGESIDFDEAKVGSLSKNKSTRADVLSLLGEPTGRHIYPMIAKPGQEELTFLHVEYSRAGRVEKRKFLKVLLSKDGTVADYQLNSSSQQ